MVEWAGAFPARIETGPKQSQGNCKHEIATPLGFDTPLRGTQPAGFAMTYETL